ncbi:TonB-dependent receptor plug domain-containing protein [Niabella hibiscisoli]|uniref:TonB-dependent receptor plug domain-containing protein n=1 Tax=Niabella hibiscisoli TaxID=1825928 RepID=UPI001F0F6717|nr:TonB-dependent receptor plug domain-containing protein [Niabella hibiscisoli]MCH5718309.1 TonB-dependent receptor plug domain-containing protein [Niabella hibiscisoli]
MKRSKYSCCLLLCAIFFWLSPLVLLAQQTTKITGTVLDENAKPVVGASVQVKGGTLTVATGSEGEFTIDVAMNSVLVISSVGYETQEVTVNQPQLNVVLRQKAAEMDQVVVVGYGTRKKSDVTGAIASVGGDDLRSVPVTNLTQALQGRVSGVVSTPNSFRPGSGSTIRIRGNRSLNASNEPLYVVDGFPVTYTIDDMNPADIESIDILKDASATAVYGVRGANGVVQITTKKGKAGKVNVTYMGSKSVDQIIRQSPIYDGPGIADAWRQAFLLTGNIPPTGVLPPLPIHCTITLQLLMILPCSGRVLAALNNGTQLKMPIPGMSMIRPIMSSEHVNARQQMRKKHC